MLRRYWVLLSVLVALLAGCQEARPRPLLETISGVWMSGGEYGQLMLHSAGGSLQMVYDGDFVPLTVESVDKQGDTLKVKVVWYDGVRGVWTLRRIWNRERTSFQLGLTLHNGMQQEFAFERKLSTEDMALIERLRAGPGKAAQAPEKEALSEERVLTPAQILAKYRVSYDCAKAAGGVEKMVCADSKLGQLDGLLLATYRSRLTPQFGADPGKMKAGQREWMKRRDACGDRGCIELAYREQIAQLCGMAVVSGVRLDGDCDWVEG